ncbi:MAG: hypothetical protein D6681_09880 [Calditrichaeota bacterium]|nr:MAG: hypothetical protein D6681_09880 [Calditrichota bacterium]
MRLRGPLRHKIGHGKAVGLGSVAIHVRKLNHIDRSQGLGALRRFDGEDLESLIAEKTADYRNDGFPTMVQARKMMVWDPHDPRDIRYPSYSWLKSNSRVPLKPI